MALDFHSVVTLEEGAWECFERVKSLSSRLSVHLWRKVLSLEIVRLASTPGSAGGLGLHAPAPVPEAVAQSW